MVVIVVVLCGSVIDNLRENPAGFQGCRGVENATQKEDTGSVSSLRMVLKTPLHLIVLQRCSCRGRCDM